MNVRYCLLGPLEALVDGEPAALPGGKPRALLACLLLDPGRVVSVDALAEALWTTPPASAHKVVQVYVSQLRKLLGKDAIDTREPGDRVPLADTDLAEFERFAEDAAHSSDPARRAELLGQALDLWRGPALVEFRDEPFAEAAERRLADLRLHALEERIDAELELGEHARLVPELEALVGQEPLRERPRAQLMLALYRSGQQAELVVCGPLEPTELERLLNGATCDVALAPRPELPFEPSTPILVPFGGDRPEWAALELAAWLARAHGLELRLLGIEAAGGRRDASRLLASASLALQRFAAAQAEPLLVPPGADGILAQEGSALVASLPGPKLDGTRAELVARTTAPLLLVHGGLRPGGLAPEQTLTRFSWSLAG